MTVDDTIHNNDIKSLEQQKQVYENMTYDQITQHMEQNYKELSEILGSQHLVSDSIASLDDDDESASSTTSAITLFDDERIVDQPNIDESTKRIKMNKLFSRAASSGDLEKLTMFLNQVKYRQYIDINVKDEDGTTPLICASCFGKLEIVQALLDANADTNMQDSFGWSALMWATNNNHEHIVKLLLDHGASSNTKSAKGRTVMDFVNTEKNHKMADIILSNTNSNNTYNPRDSLSSTTSSIAMGRIQSSTSSMILDGDQDFYYHSTLEGYDSFMADEADRRQNLLDATLRMLQNEHHDHDDNLDDHLDGYEEEDDDTPENKFCWDKCLPDQMFVFNQENLTTLLDTIVHHAQVPPTLKNEDDDDITTTTNVAVWTPANIIFLVARFAHYFCTSEVLDEVLQGSLERINRIINANTKDINILTYWMTNFTQLLYYLKKDHGLVGATATYQLQLSEYISETYTLMVHDVQHRLSQLLEPGMLGYGTIPGMEDVNFVDDWQRFFRRSNSNNNSQQSALTAMATTTTVYSADRGAIAATPRTVIAILSSALQTMQVNRVHPTIIIQALAQFLHFISCDLFNHLLTNKKLLCRSKALQIRMNLSYIEDWIRQQHLPTRLLSYLVPTIQVLQLLQCLSQLKDVASLMDTMATCDTLNALQVKRCIVKYRYEVGERRIPEDIEQYVVQLAGDMVKYRQARQSCSLDDERPLSPQQEYQEKTITTSMVRSSSDFSICKTGGTALRRSKSSSRPESMYQILGNFMSGAGLVASHSEPPMPQQTLSTTAISDSTTSTCQNDNQQKKQDDEDLDDSDDQIQHEEDVNDMYETKDTKFLLPFKVPPMAHMNLGYASDWYGFSTTTEGNKTTGGDDDDGLVPTIPDAWMEILDGAH
ncbi:uncharacterized protein BX664DRAFT_385654 [Halteromyces radiatus]|uniref:uncharacterized protein n=1 Tax=Halteromyces radiatus TaxID=101107 RepID=UPI002220BA22|nr:uncharacterized protein BX664DRAFT_385654 [Halteromyces radiatus]KAI8089111.1 hypothetical protein BX664DRAFT_385654 [Halteromyces radiatus]